MEIKPIFPSLSGTSLQSNYSKEHFHPQSRDNKVDQEQINHVDNTSHVQNIETIKVDSEKILHPQTLDQNSHAADIQKNEVALDIQINKSERKFFPIGTFVNLVF